MSLLRQEYNMDTSVEMCKKMLVGFSSVFEFLNGKFGQDILQLDGWSEHVNENKDEYDEVFEELYEKYQDKINVPPEVRIMMMVGGSVASYHVMNSMAKKMGMGKQKPETPSNTFYQSPFQNTQSHQQTQSNATINAHKVLSNPSQDDDKDIQDILREINKENKPKQDDEESLSSTTTTIRRKRGKKKVDINDI
jgi:hypothetical protein